MLELDHLSGSKHNKQAVKGNQAKTEANNTTMASTNNQKKARKVSRKKPGVGPFFPLLKSDDQNVGCCMMSNTSKISNK